MGFKKILNVTSLFSLHLVQYFLNSYYVMLCEVLITVTHDDKAQTCMNLQLCVVNT